MPGAPQGSQHPKCVLRSPQPPSSSREVGSRQRQRRGSAVLPPLPSPVSRRWPAMLPGGCGYRCAKAGTAKAAAPGDLARRIPAPGDPERHVWGLPGALYFVSQRKHSEEASLAGEAARRAERSLCKVPGRPHPSRPPCRISGVLVQSGLGLCQSWGEWGCFGAALVPQARAQSQKSAPQLLIANQLLISSMSDAGITAHMPGGWINTAWLFRARSLAAQPGHPWIRRARGWINTALPFPAEPGYLGIRGCAGHRQQPGFCHGSPAPWPSGHRTSPRPESQHCTAFIEHVLEGVRHISWRSGGHRQGIPLAGMGRKRPTMVSDSQAGQ